MTAQTPSNEQTIPVVNLQSFLKGSPKEKQNFIETTGDALTSLGFFALEGHGIDSQLIADAYQTAEDFFLKPTEHKALYEDPAINGQRGYTSFGKEHAKDSAVPDLKEFWHVGRELETNHPLYEKYPKNIWPQDIPKFNSTFQELYHKLDQCSAELLKACSLYIGEKDNFFPDMAALGDTILRIIHYPPVPEDVDAASVRAAAHEDINFITLLCESTASGLELKDHSGNWLPIASVKGQIIVDAGDMLQNITNGFFKSTTHRVVNPGNSKERRFSIPFFVHPRAEVDLSPHASCVEKTDGKVAYPNISAGAFLQQRLKEIGLKA